MEEKATDVKRKREELAESEWEGLSDRELREILWSGCRGWENFSDEQIVQWHDDAFGNDLNLN
jgi:hypothetical protein